ncbi:MAG: hypothetical protein K9L62_02070 [Vallitaleaceae bacterium]|nr:hypothetical protein [Vallitaleaceae bacterium]
MKNIPVLLNHDPNRIIGNITITDEDFENVLITASPIFELGWSANMCTNEILEVSLNIKPSVPELLKKQNTMDELTIQELYICLVSLRDNKKHHQLLGIEDVTEKLILKLMGEIDRREEKYNG